MKKILQCTYIFIAVVCIATIVKGQSNKQLAYAVSDSVYNGARWNYLRKLDMRNGTYSGIMVRLLNANDTVANSPLYNGVAAIALDEKNNRLYFTAMFTDRLGYTDLRTMRKYIVTNNFTGLVPKAADQGNVFTRMVIAGDGKGYALTNDGKHLVQFNTGDNRIRNLGSLADAAYNSISVHEVCSSYGGDIIAAEDGVLYLVTSRNHIFKIKISTMVAKYMGTVSGLPQSFTTSSAAVDYRTNRVVISSSVDTSDIYSVDFKTLTAYRLHAAHPLLVADLANANILKLKKGNNEEEEDKTMLVNTAITTAEIIQVFPNPVTSNEFKIQFANTQSGFYNIDVINFTGQTVATQTENLSGKRNIVTFKMPALTAKGIYVVRISDKTNKVIYTNKISVL